MEMKIEAGSLIPVNTVRIVSIAMRLMSATATALPETVYSYKRRRVQQPVTGQTTELGCAIRRSDLSVLRTMSNHGSDAVRRVSRVSKGWVLVADG